MKTTYILQYVMRIPFVPDTEMVVKLLNMHQKSVKLSQFVILYCKQNIFLENLKKSLMLRKNLPKFHYFTRGWISDSGHKYELRKLTFEIQRVKYLTLCL